MLSLNKQTKKNGSLQKKLQQELGWISGGAIGVILIFKAAGRGTAESVEL